MDSANQAPRRLAIAMIVRDAEEALAETLASVREIADELVIYDTGSKDQTRTICERFAGKWIEGHWNDDFSQARNECWKQVDADWVLVLDAGETMTPSDALGIRQFIDHEASTSELYAMIVKIPAPEGQTDGEQSAQIRLIPYYSEIRWVGAIRESIDASTEELGLTLEGVPFRVHRSAREHEPQVRIRRANRNIRIVEKCLQEMGPKPDLLTCLGEAFHTLGDNARAVKCYRHAIELAPTESSHRLEAYYGILTALESGETARSSQISVCTEALEQFPIDAQLLCAMGGYLQAKGRLDLAARSYETAYNHGQVNPTVWHMDRIHEVALICWSLALQLLGKTDEAQSAVEASLGPYSSERTKRHYLQLVTKLGNVDRALEVAADMFPEIATTTRESGIRGACLASQSEFEQARPLLERAFQLQWHDAICLKWLAHTLLANQDMAGVDHVLQTWQAVEPGSGELEQLKAAIARQQSKTEHLRVDNAESLQPHPWTAEGSSQPRP